MEPIDANVLGLLMALLGVARGEFGFVAYSEPMEGSTFSDAESETKSENGTSQTCRKKKEATSVKVGSGSALL